MKTGKRLVLPLLLAALLTLTCVSGAFADEMFFLFVIRDNPNLVVKEDTERNIAYVESKLSIADRSFTHPYESDNAYSDAEFDFMIQNASDNTQAFPIWRLWFNLVTPGKYYNVTSITITLGDQSFTFTDVARDEWYYDIGGGDHLQQLLICLGADNTEFLKAFETYAGQFKKADDLKGVTVPIVLHGTEDIPGQLKNGFIAEFRLFDVAYQQSNGYVGMQYSPSTPMTVEPAAASSGT